MSAQKNNPARSPNRAKERKIDPAALAQVTGQVRSLLAFHQDMGVTAYPAMPELRQFLERTLQQQANVSMAGQGRGRQYPSSVTQTRQFDNPAHPQVKQNKKGKHSSAPARSTVKPVQPEIVQQRLDVLNQELTQCRCCPPDSESRVVLGRGSSRPRLFVVGDCLIGATSEKNLIWGKEEDAMLWRMMQAIGLDQSSVYVTNAIKCWQAGPVQSGSLMEQSCFTKLEKELQIIQPRMICAMGDTAARALLKTRAPLVRLRGRFHTYRLSEGESAKIMPTFHPRVLLQYPEMKQAVWKDLQAVQRMLQVAPLK